MYKNRINALIKKLEKNNIDALLVTKPENIFYLTSFSSDRTALVINPDKIFAVTDFVDAEAASKILKGFEIYVTKSSFAETLAGGVRKHKIKKLGFESQSLIFLLHKNIKRELKGVNFKATSGIVESFREIKEKDEILALKNAIKITIKTFRSLKRKFKPQVTELALSRYIKETMIKRGADSCSFEPIVATQPLSSQPHYRPSRKKLGRNKAIVIDMGAQLKGYNSDLTRVCAVGKISSKFASIYQILIDAQKRAIELIKPGVKISDIDFAARQYIERKGLGKFFGHALGHGIGLEIHEKPAISRNNHASLKEAMVFTIEPGIYIPGFGGLRIEDMVYINKRGCEVLTDDIDKSI